MRLSEFTVITASLALGGVTGLRLLDTANDPPRSVLAALHRAPDALNTPSGAVRPVVIALIDGLDEPTMDRLVARDAFGPGLAWSARLDTGLPSLSRPVYHTLMTGVSQPLAGLGNNAHRGPARLDTLAHRVRSAGGTVSWALDGVPWLHDLGGDAVDPYDRGPEALTAWTRRSSTDLSVLHLTAVDHAGHAAGAASPEYRRAADACAASIRALRASHRGPSEAVWFVGADHGHRLRGGHGGPELRVTRVR